MLGPNRFVTVGGIDTYQDEFYNPGDVDYGETVYGEESAKRLALARNASK